MKHVFVALICSIIVFSCKNENPAEELMREPVESDSLFIANIMLDNWPRAYRDQDTTLLKSILADNFKVIYNDGSWSDKASELNWLAENKSSVDTLHREIKRFEFIGNSTVIVAGTTHVYDEGSHSTYAFTDVFIKEKGIWRATASHVSGVKQVD